VRTVSTKEMFQVRISVIINRIHLIIHSQTDVEGKISLSLDAWTSSNNYAFLAIVAHYVNRDGNLGQHLNLLVGLHIYILCLKKNF